MVDKPDKALGQSQVSRVRRQSGVMTDPNQPPRKFTDWIVVQDLLEGAKFVRKQVSDFIDRATRFITGTTDGSAQVQVRQGNGGEPYSGPYVPIVKELREYLVLLQRRLNVWSVEVERIFRRPTTEPSVLH